MNNTLGMVTSEEPYSLIVLKIELTGISSAKMSYKISALLVNFALKRYWSVVLAIV